MILYFPKLKQHFVWRFLQFLPIVTNPFVFSKRVNVYLVPLIKMLIMLFIDSSSEIKRSYLLSQWTSYLNVTSSEIDSSEHSTLHHYCFSQVACLSANVKRPLLELNWSPLVKSKISQSWLWNTRGICYFHLYFGSHNYQCNKRNSSEG